MFAEREAVEIACKAQHSVAYRQGFHSTTHCETAQPGLYFDYCSPAVEGESPPNVSVSASDQLL